ncbi:MAG: sensor histidine kinase, partial [Desertimonas sp.]
AAVAPPVSMAAYRIVQEALTNVVRHSGMDRARVAVSASDGLVVEVHDNGAGPPSTDDTAGLGRGLVGMRERAEGTGGVAEIGAGSTGGFRVRVTWPPREVQV